VSNLILCILLESLKYFAIKIQLTNLNVANFRSLQIQVATATFRFVFHHRPQQCFLPPLPSLASGDVLLFMWRGSLVAYFRCRWQQQCYRSAPYWKFHFLSCSVDLITWATVLPCRGTCNKRQLTQRDAGPHMQTAGSRLNMATYPLRLNSVSRQVALKVLTAVPKENSVFRITLFAGKANVSRRFGGWIVSSIDLSVPCSFLAWFTFRFDDGSNILLRNLD
jgi:hypothetical protein